MGGALIPPIPLLQDLTADAYGLRYAFLVPVIWYVYVVWYGLKGYKVKAEKTSVGKGQMETDKKAVVKSYFNFREMKK